MKEPVRGIIFDFGNVICRFDNRRFLEALSRLTGHPVSDLKVRIYGLSHLVEAFESGSADGHAFLSGISRLCGCELEEEVLIEAYTQIFTPIESTFDLIHRLRPHYRLGLLSNTNPWHFNRGIRTCPIFPLFDAVTLSYEVGALKPEPRIYADAVTKLGLPPEACLFIDDRPEFTEAAERCGLRGIPYTDDASLRAALSDMGVQGLA